MIGNWLLHNEVPVSVLIIDRAMVLVDSSRDPKSFKTSNVHVSALQGLSITYDTLRRSGFKLNEDVWYHPKSRDPQDWNDPLLPTEDDFFIIRNDDGLYQLFNTVAGDWYQIGKPFQFVHQLQNLYFALTGEQLELSF